MSDERIACRTPNPDQPGITRIPARKFITLRQAILKDLTPGSIAFSEPTDRVRARLNEEELSAMGSLGWHVTTVKLELEVRGENAHLPGVAPQMLSIGTRA